MAKKRDAKKSIRQDTRSGSIAYNRLDMQVSQAIQMAVEMYQDSDYLFVLDHYDDITIFDKEDSPVVVSYYQMKSSEEAITINTVLREEWLPKLYLDLKNAKWKIEEIGLITSCVLKIPYSKEDDISEQILNSEKTAFSKIDLVTQGRIKQRISEALSIPIDKIDLSKFVHMRTTLSIAKHRDIAEQNLNDFLLKSYPNITLNMAKTIFNTLVELMSERQSCETLSSDADFESVRKHKGVSKNDFVRIIDTAMLVCIPPLDDIVRWSGYQESERKELSLAYLNVVTDEQKKSETQRVLFKKVNDCLFQTPRQNTESMLIYANRIRTEIGTIPPIYDDLYFMVVVVSILINRWRRDDE